MTERKPETRKIKSDDNAWYRLATLHGEPTGFGEIHERNREVWNRCLATKISAELRDRLIKAGHHPTTELTPPDDRAWEAIEVAFAERSCALVARVWRTCSKRM